MSVFVCLKENVVVVAQSELRIVEIISGKNDMNKNCYYCLLSGNL